MPRFRLLLSGSVIATTCFFTVPTAQAALLSVVDWNMANKPNNATDQSDLNAILSHIHTVAGRPLDLLAMMETDLTSAADTQAAAQTAFGTSTYSTIVGTPDGGSDRTGFIFNTSTLSLLASQEVTGLTHHVVRAHFQPIGGTAKSDFYIYSVHLKSGSGTAEKADRTNEAQLLRADADGLGAANVMFVGDFNWLGAKERGTSQSAYDVFSGNGPGHVDDAVGQVGEWRDNPTYLSLHTNDPGAAMDDRFDMQLISDELHDGVGLDYLSGSYNVIGNNGTHTLNSDIRTGTGAPVNVLNALYNFSDHLPVFANYSFAVPEPTTLVVLAGTAIVAIRRRRR